MSEMSRIKGWKRISKRILTLSGGICALCGRPGADTVDHIIPRSRGGTHEDYNLRAAHRACNSRRGKGDRVQLPRSIPSRW
jgi:5-methylcytosine-specific restriction endonuclease McrA